MKRKTRKKPRGKRRRTESDGGFYHIGYGRPPKKYQFKPGQSGYPRGRPKGAKNHDTILHEILHRKLPIRDRGTIRHVPLIEAMFLKFAEEALRGNPKAAAFLLNRYAPPAPDESIDHDLSRDDQEILTAFAHRIKAQSKSKGA